MIGEQVQRHRRRHQWTRKQLAEECQRLGDPDLTFAAITSIETGRRDETGRRRRDVTVDELAVLARALDVPPALLLFPIDSEEEVTWSPDARTNPWSAIQWLSGAKPAPDQRSEHRPDRMRPPLEAYHDHEDWQGHWWQSYMRSQSWEERAEKVKSADTREKLLAAADLEDEWRIDAIEGWILDARVELLQAGVTPPELSTDGEATLIKRANEREAELRSARRRNSREATE
ncbi:hypothetical protein GCM10010470_27900 [Saccharopolyspora taberi]|uniref:HTH cro/C1-type domain-containing protein n=2 Tax=Saccharopolyspora taberi TaxID=60895 RepID=A0ABN3VCI7_9PSEU